MMKCHRLAILLSLLIGFMVLGGTPVLADNLCKPAAPSPQSKCTMDSQCCSGLVCAPHSGSFACQPECRIGGKIYPAGALNPSNMCQSCQPSVSTTSFTNNTNGTACNDGNACTQTDTCQAGVCVGSNPVVCAASDQCHVGGT